MPRSSSATQNRVNGGLRSLFLCFIFFERKENMKVGREEGVKCEGSGRSWENCGIWSNVLNENNCK